MAQPPYSLSRSVSGFAKRACGIQVRRAVIMGTLGVDSSSTRFVCVDCRLAREIRPLDDPADAIRVIPYRR